MFSLIKTYFIFCIFEIGVGGGAFRRKHDFIIGYFAYLCKNYVKIKENINEMVFSHSFSNQVHLVVLRCLKH